MIAGSAGQVGLPAWGARMPMIQMPESDANSVTGCSGSSARSQLADSVCNSNTDERSQVKLSVPVALYIAGYKKLSYAPWGARQQQSVRQSM